MDSKKKILEVEHLSKHFKVGKKIIAAVDDVSFYIYEGETFGIVGESGCGKTTCGRTAIGMYDKTSGIVTFKGKDVHSLKGKERKEFTKEVQIIMQDPYASLDPMMKVRDIIAEGLKAHNMCNSKEEMYAKVRELLKKVGLHASDEMRYAHEFSGGQRQRIGIARALAMEPSFIVCDEPISALDVSVQAQIINLLIELQKEKQLTYLFIAHDLSMVKYISNRIAVMYLGNIVELGDSLNLYKTPLHPYTQALLSAVPSPDPKAEEKKQRIRLSGECATCLLDEKGCRFKNRCKYAKEICYEIKPQLMEKEDGHFVACHLYEEK